MKPFLYQETWLSPRPFSPPREKSLLFPVSAGIPFLKALSSSPLQAGFRAPGPGPGAMAKGRDRFRLTVVLGSVLTPPVGNQVLCTISPRGRLHSCLSPHLPSFLLPERARPSRSFLRHPPDLASEIQRCMFPGRPLRPGVLCLPFWGSASSNRLILQAMLPPGGVSRRCDCLWSGARKPQVQGWSRGRFCFHRC